MKSGSPCPLAAAVIAACLFPAAPVSADELPASFDLRNVAGQNYVTSVKEQQGGTCWTFGAMAAIEGNLLMNGNWAANGESGEPGLAEYHLDWWNGFNQHNNDDTDPPDGGGLTVHMGGDYLVTSAYLTRGEGAVRDIDGQSYVEPPLRSHPDFHHYYPRHIEWLVAGPDLANIDAIKQRVMDYGVMGTAMCYSEAFLRVIGGQTIHYQPPASGQNPNHAVAIIGWNDNLLTQAPQPGAWLCKNSWGGEWGSGGFFWISYYDKCCGQHPEMGAVCFRGTEPLAYEYIYYHDYHGWRDTMTDVSSACNAFTASSHQALDAVSFYVAADNVDYTVRVFDGFVGGQLLDELSAQSGTLELRGFHTIDLQPRVELDAGDDFYVQVELSAGGHPFDRSSEIPVLLGASQRVWVESAAAPGQSYYYQDGSWHDLQEVNQSANFCIKALANEYHPLGITLAEPAELPDFVPLGHSYTFTVEIVDDMEQYVPGSGLLQYRFDAGDYQSVPLEPLGRGLFAATLPAPDCGDRPEFYVTATGQAGGVATLPAGAPQAVYSAIVGQPVTALSDDFETDQGWTVENGPLETGAWERVVPLGSGGLRGDPTTDYDGSGMCFVTGNGPDEDVDRGPTRLVSPVYELPADSVHRVRYAAWFRNYAIADDDHMVVEVSGDGGESWTLVENMVETNGWTERLFTIDEYLPPGPQFRMRFSVTDDPNDSITEAAIDAFEIIRVGCTPRLIGDANCDGQVDFDDIDAFVLALTGFEGYHAAFPFCHWGNADCNDDGEVSFDDIDAFVALLAG
jgi:C1A family cysteine protease